MEQETNKDEINKCTNKEPESETQLQKEEEKTEKQLQQDDPELDVRSETFNALKALYATDYRVTEKQPKIIYQNMAAFETALNKGGIWNLNKKPKSSDASGGGGGGGMKNKNPFLVGEESTQRRFQDYQLAIKTETNVKSKHHRNLLTQMAQADGPLKQLQLYVKEGKTVKVLVRKEHGIKGYVEGVLQMFDRHWNLLLTNVMECVKQHKYKYIDDKLVNPQPSQDCSELLNQLGITLPKQDVKSLGRKNVEVKRYLPQLFLRGEHVVLVITKNNP